MHRVPNIVFCQKIGRYVGLIKIILSLSILNHFFLLSSWAQAQTENTLPSVYIEGYVPNPKSPENGVIKVYLLIQNGVIVKKSTAPFNVDETTRKITEKAAGPLLLSAGFIDLHGHLKYNVIPLWTEAQGQFNNRFEWRAKSSYKKNVTSYLNNDALGSSTDKNSLLCQTYQYAEIKALIGGVTSVQGIGQDTGCTAGLLARNVEIESDYNEATDIRVSTEMVNPNITRFFQEAIFPQVINENKSVNDVYAEKVAASSVSGTTSLLSSSQKFFMDQKHSYEKYFQRIFPLGDIRGFIAHLAEGKANDSYNKLEYKLARSIGLAQKGLVIIHGVGLDHEDLKHASQNEMSIVWSPLSNLLLYGETLNVAQAIEHGINLTLGADWSPSGSKNLLDEVKIAKRYLVHQGTNLITDRMLYNMMTINPAKALKLENKIGQIEENFLGDIVAFKLKSKRSNPFTQIIDADPADIQFVMVGGKIQIAKIQIAKTETQIDQVINPEIMKESPDCYKYKDTFITNTPIKLSDLIIQLKNIFPILDEPTSCNDIQYKKTVKNIFKLSEQNLEIEKASDEKSYDVLSEQLKTILNQR